ncbi:Ger(x)C family spore germination protein [Bacillus sp. FJAT-45350]|uniref:Ger(x)C family spore germination protein n=1 Tax=Bacillus sp. FJAT-45350 TaxID=2011014 RepID=UPI000BB9308D|nr:Ger(x)C family spore germination protein [Bacillus sp. FJAT-45350]
MKKPFFILICVTLLLSVGCWDRYELNETSIVTGMAIDKGENYKYKLTLEVLNITELDREATVNHSASVVYSEEGESIGELINKMNTGYTRKMNFSHMRAVVISKEIAKEGLLDFLDFMERYQEMRNDFNFIVAQNTSAEDVLKITYHLQRLSSFKLNTQLQAMVEEWGGDPDIRLKDFIRALLSSGKEPVLAEVKVDGSIEKGKSINNMAKTDPDTMVLLDGLAIFEGVEYKGVLPLKDARTYLILRDKLNKTSFTFSCNEKNKMSAVRVYNSKTKINAKYKDGVPYFDIKFDFDSRLESSQCGSDFSSIETYIEYEKSLAKTVKKELKESIQRVQEEFGIDSFGLGTEMERQDYHNFKKVEDHWNDEFARAIINIDVTAKIRRTGLMTKSFLHELKK